jgi:hypothetical protein
MNSHRSSSRHPLWDLYSYFVQVQSLWWNVLPAVLIRRAFLWEKRTSPERAQRAGR